MDVYIVSHLQSFTVKCYLQSVNNKNVYFDHARVP